MEHESSKDETGLQVWNYSAQIEELKKRGEEWLKRHDQEAAEYPAEHY